MDSRLKKWGDYHFGRSLTKYLQRLGQEVDTDYDPQWKNEKQADVVLVLRGKYPYEVKPGPINIIWNISHPETVSIDEFSSYDLVFIASKTHAEHIKKQIDPAVLPLLQCSDTEEFRVRDPAKDDERAGLIFVGNSRDAERPSVIWAIELGLPLQVWGRMWGKWIDTRKFVVDEYINNEDLGDLYNRSRATLNDHWPDMKRYGFINNRIFDALACGLPIVSDYHEALHELFPCEILYFSNKEELLECLNELLLNYPAVKARVNTTKELIQREFSFAVRAKTLIEAVKTFKNTGAPGFPSASRTRTGSPG